MAVVEVQKPLIVVDANTWADFFNGTSTDYVDRLEKALISEEDIAVIPIVVTEVLQGFRTADGFKRAADVLTALPVLVPNLECHVDAASLYRDLRSKGITVRGAVDCIIAQTCIDSGSTLLSPDSDFRLIAAHTELDLWIPV